jgi:hypothetical protein
MPLDAALDVTRFTVHKYKETDGFARFFDSFGEAIAWPGKSVPEDP